MRKVRVPAQVKGCTQFMHQQHSQPTKNPDVNVTGARRTPVGVTTSGTLSGANLVLTNRCPPGRSGCWAELPLWTHAGMQRLTRGREALAHETAGVGFCSLIASLYDAPLFSDKFSGSVFCLVPDDISRLSDSAPLQEDALV